MLGFGEAMTTQITKPSEKTTAGHPEEASVSPGSRALLHQDSLSELAKLLGGGEKTQQSQQASPQLNEYFSEVD